MAKKVRFTIYDVMEDKGVFEKNPANVSSPEYEKANFPRMLYHPEGEEQVIRPAEILMTPYGPKEFNKQVRLVYKIVKNAEEEQHWLAEGWHRHPADSVAASGKIRPVTSSANRVSELEARIAELEREKAGQVAQQEVERGPGVALPRKTNARVEPVE